MRRVLRTLAHPRQALHTELQRYMGEPGELEATIAALVAEYDALYQVQP